MGLQNPCYQKNKNQAENYYFRKMLTIWQAEYKHTYIENHADEKGELLEGQRIWKIHSLYVDKETWLREELRGGSNPKQEK